MTEQLTLCTQQKLDFCWAYDRHIYIKASSFSHGKMSGGMYHLVVDQWGQDMRPKVSVVHLTCFLCPSVAAATLLYLHSRQELE